MLCEMCGSEVPRTKLVVVETAAVNVCANCEKYATSEAVRTTEGEIVMPSVAQRLSVRQRRQRQRDVFETGEERELALDYPDRVRNSRRSLSLSQEELAKQINERKSVIVQIEGGSMRPNDKLV
ncbi:MAG: TIGR00270 family protein, partial [Thermoplasmata archaeon]|nr:TIGR00270 family protein [Thermoplasmata archaeon]